MGSLASESSKWDPMVCQLFLTRMTGLPRFRTLSQENIIMAELNDILRDALSLGVQDRATLAEQLLASLDHVEPGELDRIWEDEAEKRLQSLRSGNARTVSVDLVHEKANKIFDRS
jgi:putative addiction module component (TIGR02574 family)